MKFNPLKPNNKLPKIPPKINFDEVKILKKVNAANIAVSKLSGMAMSLPNRMLLIEPLTVREAVASSGIENINTTVEEVFQASLLKENKISKAQKETLHYKEALLNGYRRFQEKGFLSTNDYVAIHSVLEPEKDGIRKATGVRIMNTTTQEVLYTPPEGEELIRDLLKNYEDYYNLTTNADIDPLIKIAICHYQFEAIHPFMDGNGRLGRILMVLQFILAKRLEMPILYLSGYINNNRNNYYKFLRGVSYENNWTDWILFVLDAIETQAEETTKSVMLIRDLITRIKDEIRAKLPKIYSADLIEYLFMSPFYSQKRMTGYLGINRNTAFKYLNTLYAEGFFEILESYKEKIFYIPKFLELLK